MFAFVGTNIMFWNCQSMIPKRKNLIFLTTKTSFWLPFTAQMENRISGCLKPSTIFPTMSCLSEISIPSQKLSAVPRKTSLAQSSKIFSDLHLTYLNNDEHAHLDKRTCNTDILDMAFISPNLTKHDIQFLIGDDLGSDHLLIEISINA